jgi:hypothetical protein
MKPTLNIRHLAPLVAAQAIAQLFLIAAGASVEEAAITVATVALLAPLFSRQAHLVYRQAFFSSEPPHG